MQESFLYSAGIPFPLEQLLVSSSYVLISLDFFSFLNWVLFGVTEEGGGKRIRKGNMLMLKKELQFLQGRRKRERGRERKRERESLWILIFNEII